jgi:hypothetical protein
MASHFVPFVSLLSTCVVDDSSFEKRAGMCCLCLRVNIGGPLLRGIGTKYVHSNPYVAFEFVWTIKLHLMKAYMHLTEYGGLFDTSETPKPPSGRDCRDFKNTS